jgi:hypothetical protein
VEDEGVEVLVVVEVDVGKRGNHAISYICRQTSKCPIPPQQRATIIQPILEL